MRDRSYGSNKYPDIVSYGLAHKDRMLENSLKSARCYLKYIEYLGLKPDGMHTLFDFISSGTCHFSLNKIVPFRLEGIYVCNYDCRKPEWRAMPSRAIFIQNRVVQDNSYGSYIFSNYLYYNCLFLETVIISPKCTLTGSIKEGEPICGEETKATEELRFVQEMQRGIEDFFEAYVDLEVSGIPVGTVLADRIYNMRNLSYTNGCCKILDNFALRESMIHGSTPLSRR